MTGVRWMRSCKRRMAARTSSMVRPSAAVTGWHYAAGTSARQGRGILLPMRARCIAAPLVLVLLLTGCSVISLDLTPRIRPLQEKTVEGRGVDKILLMDISGFLSEEGGSSPLSIGTAPPRVPLLVRVREELDKAVKDHRVKALLVRINSPGGTVTGS